MESRRTHDLANQSVIGTHLYLASKTGNKKLTRDDCSFVGMCIIAGKKAVQTWTALQERETIELNAIVCRRRCRNYITFNKTTTWGVVVVDYQEIGKQRER